MTAEIKDIPQRINFKTLWNKNQNLANNMVTLAL